MKTEKNKLHLLFTLICSSDNLFLQKHYPNNETQIRGHTPSILYHITIILGWYTNIGGPGRSMNKYFMMKEIRKDRKQITC